jgi:hypothetical protein
MVPSCSEVVLACQAQSASIVEYHHAIADHLLRRSKSEPPGSAAAFINLSWLTFMLPIFYQEILDLGPVDEKRHETHVSEILGSSAVAVAAISLLPPAASQHATGMQGRSKLPGFVGRQTSALVVGSNLALLEVLVPPQCPTCPGARLHEAYECPRRLQRPACTAGSKSWGPRQPSVGG